MEERVIKWLNDKSELKKSYDFYLNRNIIRGIEFHNSLVESHLSKAEYNINFAYFLSKNDKYLDWGVVGLYYAVYHCSLALLIKKGFMSKNHNATLCVLMYYFSEFGLREIELFEDLMLKEEEVKFYSAIKEDRQKASYSTKFGFNLDDVETLRFRTLDFIKKVKKILKEID